MPTPKTLADLTPNARNPRKVTPAKLQQLKAALERFGDLGGTVYNRRSGTLVSGHQRTKVTPANSKVVLERTYDTPTATGTVAEGHIFSGGERFAYREVDWPAEIEMAASIAANKNAGVFDAPLLDAWIDELKAADFDLDLTMFDGADLEAFNRVQDNLQEKALAVDELPEIVDDEGIAPPAIATTQRGQTWQLGAHTLHCGDSRNHRAMNHTYDVVFTDPPYGVSYVSRVDKQRRKDWGGIKNDELGADGLIELVRECVPEAPFRFICCDWNCFAAFELALGKPKSVCVWDKGHFGLGKGYRRQHEFIAFYGTLNRTDLSDMWPFKRAQNYQHPTQKPVPLVAKALHDVAKKGAKVYDPFGGSGSTLLAAEQLGMAATLVEYEPKYCDVIIARWEQLTGQKAKLLT